jgi:nucleoid-associated protein YgaU
VTAETADGAGTRIALNSLNAASTARELEKILAKAAADGDIEVPGSVAANGGAIDSKTLLFDLVQRSLEDGSEKEIAAAEEMSRRAFAASAAKTQVVNGQRFYTVEAGDSLAYISLQFYGSTNAYETIFNANRTAIASPDKIQIGQRLLIPEA